MFLKLTGKRRHSGTSFILLCFRCSQSNITIEILDVNDNSPIFLPAVYEIKLSENDDVGIDVIKVVASDDDTLNSPVMMKDMVIIHKYSNSGAGFHTS